ncbi:diguanylate phosphodiesterase [Pontibacillus halophilus JSM 076056 = DSM 19796]|uniref:Diguanylate phosphodiesterase n=1 Tax=Pontibacillus halophilus JSM 076056 = DSM 19796 TaxID=1385510 RepID=A0A0A5GRH3_9BACI|nr:EAL domain-containing protein [Pontibacillus halophilus]KGX93770.1 diguanylate phosphodiesterase [Pontibacillus halophilus JSM 076056 = DSM 19796]
MNVFDLIQKDHLFHYYQPLYHLKTEEVYGYEALLRSSNQKNPELLFRHAMNDNLLYKLDTTSIEKALHAYSAVPQQATIFINIFLSTLLHPNFIRFMDSVRSKMDTSFGPPSIVFELNEAKEEEEMWDVPHLQERIQQVREMGIHFAIDDFGQGAASLKKAVELNPDYLKLDRYFSTNLHVNKRKQKLVRLFVDYFKSDTTVVLEGIETEQELKIAQEIGVNLGQGYHLGRPADLVV